MAEQDDWWKADKAITPGKPIITKRANPNADLERDKLAGEIEKDRLAAAKARKDLEDPKDDPNAKAKAEFDNDIVLKNIQRAREQLNGWTTGFGANLAEVPATRARALRGVLDTVRGNLTFDRLQQMRNESKTGGAVGNASDADMRLLGSTAGSLDQFQSADDIGRVLDDIEAKYVGMRADMKGVDRAEYAKQFAALAKETPPGAKKPEPAATVAPPGGSPPQGGPPGAPPPGSGAGYNPSFDPEMVAPEHAVGASLETNGYQRVDDPAKAGVRAKYIQMIGQGRPAADVLGYLKSVGITDPQTFATAAQQVEFRAKNPRVPLSAYSTQQLDDTLIPVSEARRQLNVGGNTDAGAFMISGADAVSAFNMARLTDRPNLTRAGIAGIEAQHPKSALAGTVVGGALAGATAEAGLARVGLTGAAGALAPRLLAADAAYGGAANYGLHGEEATVGDAVKGALIGMGGGVVARGALGTAASIVGPKAGRYTGMVDHPTIGQRLQGTGWIGDAANTTEQALQSIPVLGQLPRAARQAARDEWEVSGYKRALNEIPATDDAGLLSATKKEALPAGTGPGGEAIAYTRKAFDGIYDKARAGMKFVPDQEYAQDFGRLNQAVTNGTYALDGEAIDQLKKVIENQVISRMRNGELSGNAYKKASSNLRETIGNTSKPELRQALKDFRDILDNAARRNSDPAAVALMDAADKGYAQFKPLKDAAGMAGSDPGRFTVTGLDSVQRRALGKTNAYLEGNTYLSDYLSAGRGLKDTLPNSGSADRAFVGVGLSALGAGVNPAIPAAALGATLPYSPIVGKAVSAVLAPRNTPKLNTLADVIRNRIQPSVGYATAPLAIDYLGGPP
jgi:hypothetical protein